MNESATRAAPRAVKADGDDLRAFVLATVRDHAAPLLAVARRYSLCADDAYDAYQRALEIFLRRAERLERATVGGWLRKVVKHEALAVRAGRQASVSRRELDVDLYEAAHLPDDEERIARFEHLGRAAEALQRLKPQEMTALLLKAEGHSYQEICERTGWTYTKVNRCITEGRRAFLARYARIEAGEECERFQPLISALADGEAAARDVLELRPHLRACAACRATLREHRGAARQVAAVAPLGALLASAGASGQRPGGLLYRAWEALSGGLHERAAVSATKFQAAVEAASTGKLTAVAASTAALAGGGLVVGQQVSRSPVRPRAAGRHARVPPRPRHRHAHLASMVPSPITPTSPPRGSPAATPPVTTRPAPSPPAPAGGAPPAAAPSAAPAQDFTPEQSARTSTAPRASSSSSGSGHAAVPSRASSSGGEFGP
jgi:DNA-directed RNA polymerase specialized sigma24 family protein